VDPPVRVDRLPGNAKGVLQVEVVVVAIAVVGSHGVAS
jgi:hypothetical protein